MKKNTNLFDLRINNLAFWESKKNLGNIGKLEFELFEVLDGSGEETLLQDMLLLLLYFNNISTNTKILPIITLAKTVF